MGRKKNKPKPKPNEFLEMLNAFNNVGADVNCVLPADGMVPPFDMIVDIPKIEQTKLLDAEYARNHMDLLNQQSAGFQAELEGFMDAAKNQDPVYLDQFFRARLEDGLYRALKAKDVLPTWDQVKDGLAEEIVADRTNRILKNAKKIKLWLQLLKQQEAEDKEAGDGRFHDDANGGGATGMVF